MMNVDSTQARRPTWRRLLLALLNLLSTGAGLVWIGRYRAGLALVLGGPLVIPSIWLFPPSRGNELLLTILFIFLAMLAVGIFYIWSTWLLWRESRYVETPFPQRWHWPFWLLLLAVIGFNLLMPERFFRPIRSFYFPSESMTPTLTPSDRAWADMRLPSEIQRGDVVVYRLDGREYAKRVMAIAGDRIAMKAGVVILNGKPLPQALDGQADGVVRFSEQLPGRPRHLVEDRGVTPQDEFAELRVPEGSVFLLGDNRDNALDSRFGPEAGGPGLVSRDQVIGRIFIIYWSKDRHRIGTVIR